MNTFRAILITAMMFIASIAVFASGDFMLVALLQKQTFAVATVGLGGFVALVIAAYSFREWMRD